MRIYYYLLLALFAVSCSKKTTPVETGSNMNDQEVEEEIIEVEEAVIEEVIEEDWMPIEAEEEEITEEEIFVIVEDMPEFPGGEDAMKAFIKDNLQYPESHSEKQLVVVSFVIEKNGEITNIRVIKPATEEYNEKAIEIVKKMPRWTAGKQRGRYVRVNINLPIRFE